jgi:hypothetical protein
MVMDGGFNPSKHYHTVIKTIPSMVEKREMIEIG